MRYEFSKKHSLYIINNCPIVFAFEVDESLIRQSVEYLRAHTQKEIKKCHNFNDFEKVNTCMIDQYSSLSDGVTYNEYVSLLYSFFENG